MKSIINQLKSLAADPIIWISCLIGVAASLTGLGGLLGLEPDVPIVISVFDIFLGLFYITLGIWIFRKPNVYTPRWIISISAISTCILALVSIDVAGGQSVIVMAPALITVMAIGRIEALVLYPIFLVLSLVLDPQGKDVLTPGIVLFNTLILITIWAARNQGIRATRVALAAEQSVLQAEAQALQESQLRRFLSFFQHELRNVVDGIRGLIPSLKSELDEINPSIQLHSGASGVSVKDILDAIESNSDSLHAVTQQLLILTKEKGTNLIKKPTPVLPMLKQASIEVEARSAHHMMEIVTEIKCEQSLLVNGDATWIGLALRTAVRNAFDALTEYEYKGSIKLEASKKDTGTLIRITDEGPGFPVEYLNQLKQVSNETNLLGWTTKSGGSGLGVAFMIQVMRLHLGHVQFNNSELGAEVLFYFPG